MATTMISSGRPRTPVDDDLQALYNQVWAGFESEEGGHTERERDRDIETLYSVYGDESDYPISPSVSSPTSGASADMHYRPGGGVARHSSSAASAHGSVRRLPPTPTQNSSPSPYLMPEPEPFYDNTTRSSIPDPRQSIDSYYASPNSSAEVVRQPTSSSGRRLPAPPPARTQGLPSDPRPVSRGVNGSSSIHREASVRNAAHYANGPSPSHAYDPPTRNDVRDTPTYVPPPPSPPVNGYHEQYQNYNRMPTPEPQIDAYTNGTGPTTQYVSTNATYLDRNNSAATSNGSYYDNDFNNDFSVPGPSTVLRRPSEVLRDIANYGGSEQADDVEDGYWDDEEELEEENFINFSLLSHLAVRLRDKVPRGTHVKGSIPYPGAFTGKDIVSTIQSQIQRELAINHNISTNDRRAALQVARSLQSQLFFYEVEWGGRVLQDGVEDVYMFLGEQGEGTSAGDGLTEELPTGVVTILTRCYVPTCEDDLPCYSYSCPRRGNSFMSAPAIEAPTVSRNKSWINTVPKEVLGNLPDSEINRQTIIHKIISKEDQYIQDLDTVESVFIRPLRRAQPPVIFPPSKLEEFIDDVFGNILDLRECNKRLLEVMHVRQREQQYVIQGIGDVFLSAAADFRLAYPIYIGHYPLAEKRLKEELEGNPELKRFFEECSRRSAARQGDSPKLDLKHYLNRPSEHLQKYPVLLEAIYRETDVGNFDADYLMEAIDAIKNLQTVAQLRTFQSAMGKGAASKWEWHDLVSPDVRKTMPKEECKRQAIIFELIKGEMGYVKDMESIRTMYVEPLRQAEPPIIHPDRLNNFIKEVFHNYEELLFHHRRLMETFFEIQLEQHPKIHSVTAAMMDATLNFRDAYMEYIPNYPIASYRIDDEMANNLAFKTFVEQCVRHPDAHRLDMKNFINRPIPRLLRYELLLKGILDETPPGHDDRREIPQVLDVIKALGKDSEPGVVSAKQKVELWRYNSNLVFKHGEQMDLDLLDEHRSLIHSGKLLRQPDSGLEWNGWSELYVLLFDNYLVMTKPKERDGVTKYHVNRRPIPLDLLILVNFTDPPAQRGTGLLTGLRGRERHAASEGTTPSSVSSPESSTNDSRAVFPCTLHHNGRMGGPYILYAESAQSRNEWKEKLEEALTIRKVVQESNKVFEIETLSADTFLVPSIVGGSLSPPQWSQESAFTGKVTCSVPFNTADGRGLVAVGCAEGVWIGFRHDPKSMRRVLHLKMVTQCAMLEDFGIFLVLADKSLFAYHIEALVPTTPGSSSASQIPQKLNGTKDVHFFSVGTLHGRTLIIYMKKKGLDSIFRVLEPVSDKINERTKAPAGLRSRLGIASAKSEWFRIYRDFFLPSESFDLVFLKAKIAILCTKGFEIMDLNDFKSVTIPQRDDPRLSQLAKRCESCRPIGMFRSSEDEFLLCYDEFGLYVDKHGDPSRSINTIEWEGTAERVALHAPYILLFDSRFIEVRHVETGRLAQIIPGNEVRCIWDGRGTTSNITSPSAMAPGGDESMMIQDAQVHAVMNAMTDTTASGSRILQRAVAQHVFELLPTVPLFLPGSEGQGPDGGIGQYASSSSQGFMGGYSHSHSNSYSGGGSGGLYGSPPHSPQMRESSSWRS